MEKTKREELHTKIWKTLIQNLDGSMDGISKSTVEIMVLLDTENLLENK